jgi:hypothetical protein
MADPIQSPVYGFSNRQVATDNTGGTGTQVKENQPYIVDLITLERLYFQNIPNTIKYSPESNWMAVASSGRNNPIYHYTGSEDILAFTLSWYSDELSKQDVIKKIKWLESLSKNDGYDNKPHPVQCVWGSMFRDAKWIVSSAGPVEMGLFDRTSGMFPKIATQELILKRITDTNRTREQILSIYG